MDMNAGVPQQLTGISSKEFAAKYNSKREIYNFLACDVGIYLPPYDNVTIYFLKDLMNGRKKMLRTTTIRTIHIPMYVCVSPLNFHKPHINFKCVLQLTFLFYTGTKALE